MGKSFKKQNHHQKTPMLLLKDEKGKKAARCLKNNNKKNVAGLVFQRERHFIKHLESMGGETFQTKWKYMCMMETG